jgi:hypothetical protein
MFTPLSPWWVTWYVTRKRISFTLVGMNRMTEDELQFMEDLLSPRPRQVLTRQEWLERVMQQHDLISTMERRRNASIIRAVGMGATAADIARALRGRLTARRVRQIMRDDGLKPSGKRGTKVGSTNSLARNTGLSHIDVRGSSIRDPRTKRK